MHCPLCHAPGAVHYHRDARRDYYHCGRCRLVFADPATHLDAAAEKAVYDQHENDPSDAGYRRFLSRLAHPLLKRLTPGMQGLDYGSGPGPTLSVMLEEAGMVMAIYDPYYAPDPAPLHRRYDFVTCTETVEHFCRPARDWARLVSLVRPGGYLGIMTKLVIDRERFRDWHYRRDLTHVSFHHADTFAWLGHHFELGVERIDTDVILLHKPPNLR